MRLKLVIENAAGGPVEALMEFSRSDAERLLEQVKHFPDGQLLQLGVDIHGNTTLDTPDDENLQTT